MPLRTKWLKHTDRSVVPSHTLDLKLHIVSTAVSKTHYKNINVYNTDSIGHHESALVSRQRYCWRSTA